MLSSAQKRAAPPSKAGFDHVRRSEMLNVVEMSPISKDVSKGCDRVPLLVETTLSPLESTPSTIVKTAASVQFATTSPSAAMSPLLVD